MLLSSPNKHLTVVKKLALSALALSALALSALALSVGLLSACSFVEFEPSPYTPRRLEVVYSAQEDLTFLSWRLRDSADLSLVRFEYWDLEASEWRALSLTKTPYPASPYACGAQDVCLQAQLIGQHIWPELGLNAEPPIRSLHAEGGIFGPIERRQRQVEVTLGLSPIAIDNNVRFDARRFDWFTDNSVALKRSYEWRRVESEAGLEEESAAEHTLERCRAELPLTSWGSLSATELGREWLERASCLSLRGVSSLAGFEPTIVTAPLPPSASLSAGNRSYLAPTLTPPAFMITLSDLLVRSDSRCARLKDEIISSFREGFKRFPTRQNLSDLTPLSPVGSEPLSGCDQEFDRVYPELELLDEVKRAVNPLAPEPVSVIFLYLNNSDEPLDPRLAAQLTSIVNELNRIEHVMWYGVAVAGEGFPRELWRHYLPWRAIEVSSFEDQIVNLTERVFPFRTLDFVSGETAIPLPAPSSSASPLGFKLCELNPESSFLSLELAEGIVTEARDITYAWSPSQDPLLYLDFPPQDRVEDDDYVEERASVRYEVCDRFCDYPFRNNTGLDFPSWAAETSCQRASR